MWNSGRPDSQTRSSDGRVPCMTRVLKELVTRLRWLSTAPLGRPVVPEVYMMKAGSFSLRTGRSSGSGLTAASTVS